MIEISNISVSLDSMLPDAKDALVAELASATGLPRETLRDACITRRSVDARRRSDVHFVVSIALEGLRAEDVQQTLPKGMQVREYEPPRPIDPPDLTEASMRLGHPRPVVVGAGPAGLFCALYLARAGLRPIVLERGGDVDERKRKVDAFFEGGVLDPECNVQFGEGGAGTFSDGKLTTGTKSPHIKSVLREFVDAGAPSDILVDAKPHVGTDLLVDVVRGLRAAIEQAGGEVRFHARLDGIDVQSGRIRGVRYADGTTDDEVYLETDALVMAIGHSARDTFSMLKAQGVGMERKPFAMGVRIEHLQSDIDKAQYGNFAEHPALGPADYKLAVHGEDGRGVYTFCMCPGGTVVAAASEEGAVCVNGMSEHARDGVNANSALLVEVRPDDLDGEDPLAGVLFQREVERAAFECAKGEYRAPVQKVADMLEGRSATPSSKVSPSYSRGIEWTDLKECLPAFMVDALIDAFPLLDRKLHGFADPEAVMTAVEARSSSPVRIVRDKESLQAVGIDGLFPAGEGAGYAGGIMSAAVDGIRCAEKVAASSRRLSCPCALCASSLPPLIRP